MVKRSACIRTKKLKNLRIAEQNLWEEDVFFINSLVAEDSQDGWQEVGKCGLILPAEETATPIKLLKRLVPSL